MTPHRTFSSKLEMIAFRPLCLLAALSLSPVALTAQQSSGAVPRADASGGEIRGRLAANGTNQPVTSGSIGLRREGDSTFSTGAEPDSDGTFRIEHLRPGRYTLRVRALGYTPLTRSGIVVAAEHPIVDVGTLSLSVFATQLAAQEVTAERADVVLAPDRNVYSTKNMTAASGGTAVDVLRNVPSVEVDASNQVSLRGNQNVVVQINGRPSPLKGEQLGNFLAQLPASMVKHVEVSTNPSAKNDPEGTAGIINIVLNQDAEVGLSGGVTLGTGTTGQANASGNIGRQAGPLTVFLSYGLFHNDQQMGGRTDQTNLTIPTPAFVRSRIDGSSQPLWQNASFRSEYRFSKIDALSFDAMVSGGQFASDNASYFSDLDTSGQIVGLFDEFTNSHSRSSNQDYDLGFDHQGGPRARTFSTELRVTRSQQSGENDMYGVVRQGDASTGAEAIPAEHDRTTSGAPSWSLKADYSQPLGTQAKLETGVKGILRHNTNDFTAAYLDSASGQYLTDASRATAFDYREQIGAGYALLSQKVGKVQAQGGVRLEEAATQFKLPGGTPNADRFDNRYASAFPSGILSYNFSDLRSLKLSYSRRISRPNPYQLSPVEYRQESRAIFHGNPSLRPEYTDAVELGFQESRSWGTVQVTPYLRHTAHAVRYIRTVDTTGVTVSTFDNVASSLQTGTDLNLTYHGGPLMIFSGGSVYRYQSDAGNIAGGNFSTRTSVWSARLNATWKLSAALDASAMANYRSAMATEGGSVRAFVFSNVGLRYKLWHDKGSLTLRVTDPFGLMNWGGVTANPEVIQYTVRSFGARGIFLTFSRNFGEQLKLRPKQPDAPEAPAQPGGP
jgi:outer membrane receptor protein involved in Fe transport